MTTRVRFTVFGWQLVEVSLCGMMNPNMEGFTLWG
jgi:hypothetical protein